MSKYVINKSTSCCPKPYTGATCVEAGVEEGRIYTSYQDARIDAERLSQVKGIFFAVRTFYTEDRTRIVLTPEHPPETIEDVTQVLNGREIYLKEEMYMSGLWQEMGYSCAQDMLGESYYSLVLKLVKYTQNCQRPV